VKEGGVKQKDRGLNHRYREVQKEGGNRTGQRPQEDEIKSIIFYPRKEEINARESGGLL